MNYATKIKTAMASALCVMVGMAFAGTTVTNDVQTYGATFEASEAADNDFAYVAGQKIAIYTNNLGTAGWFAGSEDDESVISNRTAAVEGLGSQYLLLNTDAETLTNKLEATVAAGVNTAMAADPAVFIDDATKYNGDVATYEGAVFESDVKFVASDTLDAGIPGGQDATKFAIYAYCNEDADPATTNIVVFHAVRPKRGATTYTNYVFSSVDIDTTAYTHLKVVMKQVSNADKLYDVFSVTVGSGDNAVTLENEFASEVRFGDAATGNWFFTVEDAADDSKLVSSLNFKGTGEIDNIKVSQKVKETYAAIVGGIKYASWETATNVAMNTSNVLTSYEAGKTLFLQAEDFISIANVQPVATNTVSGYKVETITGDGFLTYTSKLDKATVIFLSDTGVELFRDDFQIGEPAVYGGTTPSKPADASGVYTWTGWTSGGVDYGTSDALANVVVGGATYTATFSSVASQASVNGTYYATLADAISAATGTEYPVVLNDDVALSSTIIITDDVTIDLNGHDIAATGCRAIWVKSGNVLITGEGDVTAEGPGLSATSSVIRVGDGAANANIAALTVNTNVTVASATCYGVTVFGKNNDGNNATTDITFDLYGWVEVSAPYVAHGCDAAISGNGNSGNSAVDITIHDGAVVTSDNANGIYFPSAGTLAIEGGTITGATAVYAKAGNIEISGGTLVATGTEAAYAATGDGANPTGDAIVIDNCGYPSGLSLDVAVTGGDVSSANGDPIGSFATGSGHEPKDGFVSGGTFNAPLADDLCADGFIPVTEPNGDGKYEVTPGGTVTFVNYDGTELYKTNVANGGTAVYGGATPVKPSDASGVYTFSGWDPATIVAVNSADQTYTAQFSKSGDAKATVISVAGTVTNYYPTLAAAVAAVPTDGSSYTVGILSDVTLSSKLTVTGGQKVSFQADEPVVVNGQLRILDGSSVTIGENVTFTSTGHPTVYIMGDPAVNVAGTAKSELIVNGVVANTNPDYDATFAIAGNGTDTKGADITIGTSGVVSNLNGIAIYQAFPGDLTVAGKVEGASAITIKDGTLTVQDGAVIIATGSYVAHSTNGNGASPTGDAIQVPYYPASMGYGTPVVSIEGGTITVADASNGAVGVQAYDNNNVVAPEDSESNINVEGGTFNTPVNEAYCAEGYIPEDNGNGTYGVEEGWNIKFVNYNGDELWATNVAKNAAFTYGGETPVKAADASGIYAFDGWDNDIVSPAVADATYTATFSKSGDAKATVITITDAGATTNVVGYYASLADAIHAADDGDTVVLLADETADATKTTQADRLVVTKQITIDFGEHTYSVPGSLEPTDNWCALFIDANTTLKGTTGGINCLDKEGPTDKAGVYAINVRNGATLTIEGGTYHGGGTVVQTQLGSTVINGGTFSVTAYDEPYGTDFALNCVDSAYTADTAGFAINGGTFIGFDPQDSKAEGENTDFTSDGFVAIDDGNGNFMVQAGYNVTFANYDATVLETQRVPAGETPVYGGTTPTKPADAAGVYTFDAWSPAIDAATADVTYTAQFTTATSKATVITITGTTTNTVGYYATLAAAVDAANDGDTVVLLANETISGRILVTDSITIDLGGNNVTRTAAPASDNGSAFRVDGSVTVTIKNGGIDVSGVDDTSVLTDGVWAIDAKNGANLTLADLNVVVDSRNGGCVYAWNTAHITINSGDYSNVTDEPYDHHAGWQGMAVNQANVATKLLTINGGSFSQQDPQLGDDSQTGTASASADFTSDGYVAIVEGGKFVVQEGYNVTFDANGGTPAPEAQRVAAGGTATAPADPSKADGAFAGWTLAGNAYDFDTVLSGDITLVATYEGYVAQIVGGASYTSLAAALDSVKENNLQQANIELLADASITISRNGNVLGGNSTTNITINGNNHKLHVVRDGTWAQFNTANGATLVLNDVNLTSEFTGTQTGWVGDTLQNPNHNIAFNCDVELNDVTSTTALSFWKDADLDTVTIAETVDVYSIWIHTTASNIAIKDLVVNSPTGRGIKVDDSFVAGWGGTPSASTTISVNGAAFTTKNKKSAILVRSAYPIAVTTAGTIDISGVPADTTHLVWVDEDASTNFGLVTLDGAQADLVPEPITGGYAATLSTNGTWIAGYYKTLEPAVAVADADDTLTLQKTVDETFTVSKALTITLNGYSAEGVTAGEGYERTVTAEAYVFAEAATGFVAGDNVDGRITQDQADWLNAFIDAGTYTKAQLEGLTGWQSKYLLNVDPFTGSGTLTVSAITVGTNVQVTVALARTEGETAVGKRAIKGTLTLYGTDSLGTAFAELASADIDVTDDDFSEGNTTTATFTGTGAKFFKAVIK